MGIIRFEGFPPFELLMEKNAKVGTVDESVVMMLSVFEPGHPEHVREIAVMMRFDHAFALSSKLKIAATEVEANKSD